MQCPVCHNEVGPQATFCNHCGASLAAAAPAAPAPGYAPVQAAAPSGYAEVPQAYVAPPAGYAPQPGYPQAPAPGYPPPQPAAASSGLSPNAAAAITYLTFIPAIIFLVIEPFNKIPLVRFHAWQSIALNVVYFAMVILVMVLSLFLAFIPFLHWIILFFPLAYLAVFACVFIAWLMSIIKASKGEFFKLPIIGNFCLKQAQK